MTMEKIIQLLAVTDAYFGKPQTIESRKALSTIWANSDLRDVPDDIAEQAFYKVIQHCKWQNQLLPDWLAEIQRQQGERKMMERCLLAQKRIGQRLLKRSQQKQIEK
nr:MAG TPA: replisome organizer protein [Caudoviricetes sp.]